MFEVSLETCRAFSNINLADWLPGAPLQKIKVLKFISVSLKVFNNLAQSSTSQSPTLLPPRTSTYQGTFKPLCLRLLCPLFRACPSSASSTNHNWGPTQNFPSFVESSLIPNCSVLGRNGHLLPSILLEHFVNTLTCAMSTSCMPAFPHQTAGVLGDRNQLILNFLSLNA